MLLILCLSYWFDAISCSWYCSVGLSYGITNANGKVLPSTVRELLFRAKDIGVVLLDTAQAYGNAEQVLGEVLPGQIPFT